MNPILRLTLVVILFAGIFIPYSGVRAQEELPQFPTRNYWTRVTPSVYFCDDTDGMTIEVHIVGRSDVERVMVRDPHGDHLAYDGPFEAYFTILYDDGTNGDLVAGDKIFTRSNMKPYCPENYMGSWGYATWDYYPRFELKNGAAYFSWYPIRIALVDPKYRGAFEVQEFGNGLSATSHAFFIHDANNEVLSSYPVASVTCGVSNFEAYKKLYSVLPDAFDIAMVTPGMQVLKRNEHVESIPYAVWVSNDIENIGMDIFDKTEMFGSAGRLRTVIYNSFGGIDVVDHELAHAWGVSIGSRLNLLTSGEHAGIYFGHWSPNTDIGGQMQFPQRVSGQFGRFQNNGDGTWRFVSNIEYNANEPYSPLELYVMGLIGPEEVPPIHVFSGSPNMSDPERVTFATYKTITIQDIIASEGGERIPLVADSQKNFTLAYIVTQDIPFDEAAYTYHSLMAYHLTSKEPPETYNRDGEPGQLRFIMPFYWATGGRATLETRLPVDLPDPVGLPYMPEIVEPTATVEPTAEPTSAPELEEASSSAAEEASSAAAESPGGCSLLPVGVVFLPGLWAWWKRKKSKENHS